MAVNQKTRSLLPQNLDFQGAERNEQINEGLSETSKFCWEKKQSTTRRPFPGLRWTGKTFLKSLPGREQEVQSSANDAKVPKKEDPG